jgi:hypothetical protein
MKSRPETVLPLPAKLAVIPCQSWYYVHFGIYVVYKFCKSKVLADNSAVGFRTEEMELGVRVISKMPHIAMDSIS